MSIDREKVRTLVRRLRGEDLLRLLDRAIDLLPEEDLLRLTHHYVWPKDLASDGTPPPSLRTSVDRFRVDSDARKYYEHLDVKSRYHHMKSDGTQRWIAECHRLFDRCAAEEDPGEACYAYEVLFRLLARLDAGEEFISFNDSGGSFEVGVHWEGVLPGWFRCLAATAAPEVYARSVASVVGIFAWSDAAKLKAAALAVATPDQAAALEPLRIARTPASQLDLA